MYSIRSRHAVPSQMHHMRMEIIDPLARIRRSSPDSAAARHNIAPGLAERPHQQLLLALEVQLHLIARR